MNFPIMLNGGDTVRFLYAGPISNHEIREGVVRNTTTLQAHGYVIVDAKLYPHLPNDVSECRLAASRLLPPLLKQITPC